MDKFQSLPSYSDILDSLRKKKRKPHLLLGNGFSMAYNSNIFSYNALSSLVQNDADNELKKLFDCVKTSNFETILQDLRIAYQLCKAFGADKNVLESIIYAGKKLRNKLIESIEILHPEHVFKISEEECKTCYEFLRYYIDNHGNVFYTNYDLLLYWVLMRSVNLSMDGFGRAEAFEGEDPNSTDLVWGKYKDQQSIYYLHGALPLFDNGTDIVKEEYNIGEFLIEKIRKNISKRKYPIFVTAGTAEEKLQHIMHNKYLAYSYDKLTSISGSLVTFGFQFGEYDTHIIDAINQAAYYGAIKDGERLWSVYIGVYSENDFTHILSIKNKFKCKVNIFDAKTINPWQSNEFVL